MRKILPILIIITLVLNSGCALMFLPKKQKVTIDSGNKDAKIYLDDEFVGKGHVTLKTYKDGIKQVRIEAPGYKTNYFVLVPHRRQGGWYACVVADALFIPTLYGVMPFTIDMLAGGKNFAYPKMNDFKLVGKYKTKPEDDKFVSITNIGLEMHKDSSFTLRQASFKKVSKVIESSKELMAKADANKEKADAKAAKKKKKKKELEAEDKEAKSLKYDDTKFSTEVFKTLRQSGYIDTVNNIFQDRNNTIYLEGVLKKWDIYRFNQRGMWNAYYKSRVGMKWYLKNQYGERLDSIKLTGLSGDFALYKLYSYNKNKTAEAKGTIEEEKGSPVTQMLADAVYASYNKIFKNKKFLALSKKQPIPPCQDPMLLLNKGSNVVSSKTDAPEASVIVKRKEGHGSGFAVSRDGYILTNYHVIAKENLNQPDSFTVITNTGEELKATVVRYNKYRDLALLKVNYSFQKVFQITNEKKFTNMQDVYTVGAPKSIELGQSVTRGLLSNERISNNNHLLQLSMSVNGGNSGGPLYDDNGVLHGVIVSKLVGDATEGVAFAVPGYKVSEFLNIRQ